jgi:hypothetical protein
MWGVGVWSKVGVLIHPTGVLWDSGQDCGPAIPFVEPYYPQSIPSPTLFMAGSIVMVIQTTVITILVFYHRQYAAGQNVLVSFFVWILKVPNPFHEKHPHTVMPPPPNFTVGTTHAGRYRSSGIHRTQTLPSDPNHMFPVVHCPVASLVTPL